MVNELVIISSSVDVRFIIKLPAHIIRRKTRRGRVIKLRKRNNGAIIWWIERAYESIQKFIRNISNCCPS